MSPRFFHLRRLVPLLVSFFLGCFVTVKILDYRHPTLETRRQERKLEFNNEANSLLDPKLLKTKRVNTDHPFTAWDLKLPQFYTKHEDIYSQFTCSCQDASKNALPTPSPEIVAQRKSDLSRFVKSNYFHQAKMPLVLQKPNQPIEFVSSGYEIEPDEEFTPFIRTHCGISAQGPVRIQLQSFFGKFFFSRESERTSSASIVERAAASDEELAKILENLRYSTFVFDGKTLQDFVQVTVTCNDKTPRSTSHLAIFPILIRRRPLPQLFPASTASLNDRLTIVTKTFLRYPCLYTLLDSILDKYPGITVIVADDSPREEQQDIDKEKYPSVKHYRLPESEGWFAGRGLAISQVRTEYFLWVDDDFVFNSHTDLAYMVNVADKSGYDIIGGGVSTDKRNTWAERDHFVVERASEGFCYHRVRFSNEIKLPGFEEECLVVDVLLNFFVGRTSSAGRIRMDPNFDHIGHPEYFLDGLGDLRTAWCGKSWVDHFGEVGLKTRCAESQEYKKHRGKGEARAGILKRNAELWFYRSYLQCSSDFDGS